MYIYLGHLSHHGELHTTFSTLVIGGGAVLLQVELEKERKVGIVIMNHHMMRSDLCKTICNYT